MKRLFDFILALIGLVLLAPLLIVLWIVAGLFVQERVGREGKLFKVYKFRTMSKGAEKMGPQITVGGDQRITRLGKWLRATKLDELPQLWNVLWGEMSFVGPRPEVRKYVELYSDAQREVLLLRPGITDLASLAFYNEAELLARTSDPQKFYRERVMPEKIRINLDYSVRASLLTDLMVIVTTVVRGFGLHIDLFSRWGILPPNLGLSS